MVNRLIHVVLLATLVISLTASGAMCWDFWQASDYCQILDDPATPLYDIRFAYVPISDFGDYGRSETMELEIDWALAYFRDIARSDLELGLNWKTRVFPSSTRLQLPDQLTSLAVDSTMTWRYETGQALQLSASPGVYSDGEEFGAGMFLIPFSCSVIHSFDRRLSAQVGLQFRPGFERTVMPLVNVKCELDDFWMIEAGVPTTRISYYLGHDWSAHGGYEWENTSFALREKSDYDRKSATMEDFRLFGGTTYQVSDQCRASLEGGIIFGRSLEFEREVEGLDSDIDIDSSIFFRLAVSGPF